MTIIAKLLSCGFHYGCGLGGAVVSKDYVLFCRELEEYKEKQDDNQNGGDTAKIASKHVGSCMCFGLIWLR